jgi:hypothetical protein
MLYPRGVAHEARPTGRLILTIDERQVEGSQRRWADGKNRKLESEIRDIVETILVAATKEKERLAAESEERRREEEAECRRQAEEERRRDEQQRVRSLIREARRWQLSQIIHSYVDAAERADTVTTSTSKGESLQAWITWARVQASNLDPVARAVRG